MPVQYLPLLARALGVRGRTLCWPLQVRRDGSLRCRGLKLRLYGLSYLRDPESASLRLGTLLAERRCRWRILSVDRDGTLAVLVRDGRGNVAVSLLREGLALVPFSPARRLRAAQEAARCNRLGLWRYGDQQRALNYLLLPNRSLLTFPWWQG